MTKDSVYLDAGAGRGTLTQMNFKDLVKHAAGVDPSDAILKNPYLHEAHVGTVNDMPFIEDNNICEFRDS